MENNETKILCTDCAAKVMRNSKNVKIDIGRAKSFFLCDDCQKMIRALTQCAVKSDDIEEHCKYLEK